MVNHPCVTVLSKSFSRTDLFGVVYYLMDEWMKKRYGSSNAPRQHRGPRAKEFADSEVLTILLVQELCHCPRERAWLRQIRGSYHDLFPALPEDSRFWRRAHVVRYQLQAFRAEILFWADADLERIRILDSFPLPLCACYRIHQSSQPITGSGFAWNNSKRLYYFGLHPLLVMTDSGFIDDIFLGPAHYHDRMLAAAYLDECAERGRSVRGQDWIADKGFQSRPLAEKTAAMHDVFLLARERDYDKEREPSFWQQLLDMVRKPVEGVIAVLTECFGIEHMLVHSDWGLYRRVQAKATAFSLARYFNKVLSHPPMDIARYAV